MRGMAESYEIPPRESDTRLEQARAWLSRKFHNVDPDWAPVSGDASYRRYFRLRVDGQSRILMDAPPKLENSAPFVDIDQRLREAGLHAPEILLADLDAGFLLLEDLGDELYRDLLMEDTVQALFDEAFPALAVMATGVRAEGLPLYDRKLFAKELNWFTDLYLGRHRNYPLSSEQQEQGVELCRQLIETALEQPQVFVHKDVHSCNLLRTGLASPGIIDFQDAVSGPLTYDFVSLIWDRYIAWPRAMLEGWMEQFRQLVDPGIDPAQWVRWCDLMGLQRNIKIVGRFSLLCYEQKKSGYLEMIPGFYGYMLDVLPLYPEFDGVRSWLEHESCAP